MTATKATTTAAPATDVAGEAAAGNLPAVPENGHVPAPVDFTQDEWAGVDDGDLAPAGETLLPLIAVNRKMGEGIVSPTTGELVQELEFIWLARTVTRAWWDKSFDERDPADPAPKCRSIDGTHGVGAFGLNSELNPSGKCATCPASSWSPPDGILPCRASIEAMVALPDSADGGVGLFRLRFNGIAFAPARAFWDSFRARLPKIPAIGFLSEMRLEVTDTKNGKFLSPVFTRLQQLRRSDVEPLIAERDRLIDEFKRLTAEDLETGAVDVDEQRGADAGGPFDGPPNERPFDDSDRRQPPAAEAEAVATVQQAFGDVANDGDPGPTYPDPDERF